MNLNLSMSKSFSKQKEAAFCFAKRALYPRGTEVQVNKIPLYTFSRDEVVYNFNTTNYMIKTPKGYFRICLEHLPLEQYTQQLLDLYSSALEIQKLTYGEKDFLDKGLRIWKYNSNKYRYQTYNACSSLAEEKMAELLGLDRLLTRSFFCRVQVDGGKEMVGTMASFADGIGFREIQDMYQVVFTPELCKELTNLNIIDVICYEKDHCPRNYNIVLNEEGQAISICSFDNDTSWSFSPIGGVAFRTYAGASHFVKNGVINRPFLDLDVCDRLFNLSLYDLEINLSNYLRKNQIKACWRRVKTIQKAINNTHFQYGQWDEELIKTELSGKYGDTYYSILWNLCTVSKK